MSTGLIVFIVIVVILLILACFLFVWQHAGRGHQNEYRPTGRRHHHQQGFGINEFTDPFFDQTGFNPLNPGSSINGFNPASFARPFGASGVGAAGGVGLGSGFGSSLGSSVGGVGERRRSRRISQADTERRSQIVSSRTPGVGSPITAARHRLSAAARCPPMRSRGPPAQVVQTTFFD